MTSGHSYCEDSAALGEGFPDLVGGVLGLAVGLVRGSMLAARRLAEQAIWMDAPSCSPCGCGCASGCRVVHRVVISDCGPYCRPCCR
jgi:hypothetical protein